MIVALKEQALQRENQHAFFKANLALKLLELFENNNVDGANQLILNIWIFRRHLTQTLIKGCRESSTFEDLDGTSSHGLGIG